MVIVRVIAASATKISNELPGQPTVAEDDWPAFGERSWHVARWYEYPASEPNVAQANEEMPGPARHGCHDSATCTRF
jgi:hypothetical protein